MGKVLFVCLLSAFSFNAYPVDNAPVVAPNPWDANLSASALVRQKIINRQLEGQRQAYQNALRREYDHELSSLNLLKQNLELLQGPDGIGCFRLVDGATNYIFDYSNGWVQLDGKVFQTLPDGILLKPEDRLDCFVEGYPFQTVDEQEVGLFVAKSDGVYSYTATSGGLRTVKKFVYGKAVIPSSEMVSVEINKLNNEIANHPLTLKIKAAALASKKSAEAANAAKVKALQSNQEAANQGDIYGLLRMGERYRDGDGVKKDLVKAREYLQRSANAGSETAKDELSNLPAP